jgi:tetratricopeptide (TPR) repeat protein
MMAPERNKIDHINVQDKAEMLEMRKEFIGYVNEVMRIIYHSSKAADDAPVTITVCDSSLIFEGWEAVENKEYQKVIEIADTILKKEEISAEAYSMKACAYMNLDQLDQAMTFIDKALEEDPDDSDNLVLKGNIYGMKEVYIQALAWYSKAVTAYLWNDDALYDIGLTYHKMGDYGMALETFARLKEMNPDYPQLAQGIEDAEYNLQLFRSNLEGYDNILQTKELTPEEKEIIGVTRAIDLFHVGRYEDAITEAEKWKNSAKKYLENPQVFDLSIELSLSALGNLNKVQKIYAHPYYTKDNLPKLN